MRLATVTASDMNPTRGIPRLVSNRGVGSIPTLSIIFCASCCCSVHAGELKCYAERGFGSAPGEIE